MEIGKRIEELNKKLRLQGISLEQLDHKDLTEVETASIKAFKIGRAHV